MTQGDLLSLTIFNVVVYAVVKHRMTVMVEDAEEWGKHEQGVRHQAALLYADDGMVALSEPRWIQGAFNTLVGLFYRLGLRTSVGNIVGMI